MQVTVVEYINEFFTQYSRRAYGKTLAGNASKGAEVFMGESTVTQQRALRACASSLAQPVSTTLALLQIDSSSTTARFPLFLPLPPICCSMRAGMLKLVLSRGGRDELRIALHCFKDQLTAAINRSITASSSHHHPPRSSTKQSASTDSSALRTPPHHILHLQPSLTPHTPFLYRCCHCALHTPRALRPKHTYHSCCHSPPSVRQQQVEEVFALLSALIDAAERLRQFSPVKEQLSAAVLEEVRFRLYRIVSVPHRQ